MIFAGIESQLICLTLEATFGYDPLPCSDVANQQ